MIPFRDDNPTSTFPTVVVLLLALNVGVFLYQVTLAPLQELIFVYTHGAIPAVVLGKATLAEALARALPPEFRAAAATSGVSVRLLQPAWLSVFTSMFLHGDLLHLGSNMLYLWIFGNNVEDALGHARFLLFYLLCGLIAAGVQVLVSAGSLVPMVGASGAIAGVLGAYYVKFPHARVRCVVFLFFFITVVMLPAGLVLLIWFLIQVLNSVQPSAYGSQGGVAVFAHIGGFLAGWALIRRFEPRRRLRRFVEW
jgi:membrane associated rhomboid family serine protease